MTGGAVAQIATFPRPEEADTSTFGVSVAMDDSIAAVGASGEEICGPDAGAVYVYERVDGITKWQNTARLTPRDCRENMFFGGDVAVSGRRVLVGASSEAFPTDLANAAYVFERTDDGDWIQTARLTGDRNRQEGLFAAGLDLEGDRAVVTTSGSLRGEYSGAVYIFNYDRGANVWRRSKRLTASPDARAGVLGNDVSLHGDYLAVAASTFQEERPGSVYLFRYDDASEDWVAATRLRGVDAFFIDVDLHDMTLVVGEDRAGPKGAGEATVYRKQGEGQWEEETVLRPPVAYESGAFGTTVSLHEDTILAAGYNEQLGKEYNIDRVVYTFRRADDGWNERQVVDIGKVDFGADMAQGDRMALISSVPENEAGTVYVVGLP